MARNGEFDIGAIFSMDHDFAPAIERVSKETSEPTIETVVWRKRNVERAPTIVGDDFRQRHSIWNHELTESDYNDVRDSTNYTLSRAARGRRR